MFRQSSLCGFSLERSPKIMSKRSGDRSATSCSQSTRSTRRAAYVNNPHVHAALFVHDRGEKVDLEQLCRIACSCVHENNLRERRSMRAIKMCRTICIKHEHRAKRFTPIDLSVCDILRRRARHHRQDFVCVSQQIFHIRRKRRRLMFGCCTAHRQTAHFRSHRDYGAPYAR